MGKEELAPDNHNGKCSSASSPSTYFYPPLVQSFTLPKCVYLRTSLSRTFSLSELW